MSEPSLAAFQLFQISKLAHQAVCGRIKVICHQLAMEIEIHEMQTLPEVIARFILILESKVTSPKDQLGIFLFGLKGRYEISSDWSLSLYTFQHICSSDLNTFALKHAESLCMAVKIAKDIDFVAPRHGSILVDVTHTSRFPGTTGIQRVVRAICSEWALAEIDFSLFRTTSSATALLLTDIETGRFIEYATNPNAGSSKSVLEWRHQNGIVYELVRVCFARGFHLLRQQGSKYYLLKKMKQMGIKFKHWMFKLISEVKPRHERETMICFLNSKILVPEIIGAEPLENYFSICRQIPVQLTVIIYDLIPIYFPEYCMITGLFSNYLRLLRVADKVSCISPDIARQLNSFVKSVPRSNGTDLRIESHELAGDIGSRFERPQSGVTTPIVLSVGTIEPRKNQLGILRAAVELFKRGRHFELIFAGRSGWLNEEFLAELKASQKLGLPIRWFESVNESQLKCLYEQCYFTVFCSFAEGFGLPIIESLNFGRPCVVSNIGSMLDIGQGGGCIVVDPHSIWSVANGMDVLLNDIGIYSRCVAEIEKRPVRTWAQYASELSHFIKRPDHLSCVGK